MGGNHRSVVANILNNGIVISEFKLQPHYYVHFQTNTVGKGIESFMTPDMD